MQAQIRRIFTPRIGSDGFVLDVSISVGSGISALFGPQRAGKSATLEAIAGLMVPDEGRIEVDGEIWFDARSRVNLAPHRRSCCFVPAGSGLFPHMTLKENLLFSAGCRRMSRLERHRRAAEVLECFALEAEAGRYPGEVSGSARLRAVLARAVIARPRLLLLDETARNLDAPLRNELYQWLRRIRDFAAANIILATSSPQDCFEVCDQVFLLVAGKVVQAGAPQQVWSHPATVEAARALGGFNLLEARIVGLDPVRKTSRLALGPTELTGPYFPGRLLGDRVTLCLRPAELSARPAAGPASPNRITLRLERVLDLPHAVRLSFEGGIDVEMSHAEYDEHRHHREWAVEFPTASMRVL